MTFSNIDQLSLGSILQIAFSKGTRTQISQDFRDFEQVRMAKVSSSAPRSIRFYFQNGLLPSNIQWRNPGTSNRAFPRAFQPATAEYEAKMKEANASLELEYNLYERAKQTPEKYAEPLQMILSAAMTSAKREIARVLYKDGTGVIAQVGAAAAALTSPNSSSLNWTIDQGDTTRGHVGDFEYDELYVLRDPDASATALDTSLATEPAYWKCVAKDRAAGTVQLQGLTAAFAPVASITSITTQAASGAVFYKFDQPTIPDLTASIADYGTVSESMAGLESLAANDGRVVHGITMSGVTGSSEKDAGNVAIDLSHFNSAMDQAKIEVGQDRYKWKKAMCAPETQSALIESREGDRRFTSKEDARTGSKQFGIQHRQDFVELVDSEYVHPKRIWVLPESKAGEKVIEYHGTDFATVKAPSGDDFHLKVSGGEYVNSVVSYLQAVSVLICKHPKSVIKIRNFTN
jgi:hypothetical protein